MSSGVGIATIVVAALRTRSHSVLWKKKSLSLMTATDGIAKLIPRETGLWNIVCVVVVGIGSQGGIATEFVTGSVERVARTRCDVDRQRMRGRIPP